MFIGTRNHCPPPMYVVELVLSMPAEVCVCRSCDTPTTRGATSCPECGYDIARHNRWRFVWGLPGMLLIVSGLFAPLGVPLLMKAHRHRLAAEGSVTTRKAAAELRRGVFTPADQSRASPLSAANAEFTRGGSRRDGSESREGES